MKISSLKDIVNGKLQNNPAISFITQSHISANKINEGDAFFCIEKKDVELAIDNGAFSIIHSFDDIDIIDNEIAWIKVDNIYKAISSIIRYYLIDKDIEYICLDKISHKFYELYKNSYLESTIILTNDIYVDFETLTKFNNINKIISINKLFLKEIGSNIKINKITTNKISNLTTHTLFETSFTYNDNFYEKIKIPNVYINYLIEQIKYIENGKTIDLKRLNNIELFRPIFLNKSNQIIPHGQSNRFIISNKDIYIAKIEIQYLEKNYSYAKIKVLYIENKTQDEIYNIITKSEFNALYLVGIHKDDVSKIIIDNYHFDTLVL